MSFDQSWQEIQQQGHHMRSFEQQVKKIKESLFEQLVASRKKVKSSFTNGQEIKALPYPPPHPLAL